MTDNTVDAAAPDTIVLIHGFWMTPRRRTQHDLRPESTRLSTRVATEGGDSYEQWVTPLELFFDLVFVFALTQLARLPLTTMLCINLASVYPYCRGGPGSCSRTWGLRPKSRLLAG